MHKSNPPCIAHFSVSISPQKMFDTIKEPHYFLKFLQLSRDYSAFFLLAALHCREIPAPQRQANFELILIISTCWPNTIIISRVKLGAFY